MTSSNGNIFRVTGHLCGNSPVTGEFPAHKGQWHVALMFSLISAWINCWVNNREAGDLRRYCAHYDVTVMCHHNCIVQLTMFAIHVSVIICHLHPATNGCKHLFIRMINFFCIFIKKVVLGWLVKQSQLYWWPFQYKDCVSPVGEFLL